MEDRIKLNRSWNAAHMRPVGSRSKMTISIFGGGRVGGQLDPNLQKRGASGLCCSNRECHVYYSDF